MTFALSIFAVIAGIVGFFWIANRLTARAHRRFRREDVEAALTEFVSPGTKYYDGWDLFLAWPIADPNLEAVRQQCLRIVRENPESAEAARAKVASVLAAMAAN